MQDEDKAVAQGLNVSVFKHYSVIVFSNDKLIFLKDILRGLYIKLFSFSEKCHKDNLGCTGSTCRKHTFKCDSTNI